MHDKHLLEMKYFGGDRCHHSSEQLYICPKLMTFIKFDI